MAAPDHVLRDGSPHRRQGNELVALGRLGCGRWRRSCRSGRWRGGGGCDWLARRRRRRGRCGPFTPALDVLLHVLLGDAAPKPRAPDLAEIEIELGGQPAHRGAGPAGAVAARLWRLRARWGLSGLDRARRLRDLGGRRLNSAAWRGRSGRLSDGGLGTGLGSRLAPADGADQRPHRNRLAFLDIDLRQHAVHRRGDFGVDLVGDDLEQRLVLLHPVTRLLQPPAHLPFGHALSELRHGDARQRSLFRHLSRLASSSPGRAWLPGSCPRWA